MIRILLAEDDPSLRKVLARSLRQEGHAVEAVGDGLSALEEMRRGSYDLLLADIVMPGLNGIELAHHAASEKPATRIMLITGFAAVALQARDEAPRSAQIMSKPIHLRELVEQLDMFVAA